MRLTKNDMRGIGSEICNFWREILSEFLMTPYSIEKCCSKENMLIVDNKWITHFIFYFSVIYVPVTFAYKINANNLVVDYDLMAEILAAF